MEQIERFGWQLRRLDGAIAEFDFKTNLLALRAAVEAARNPAGWMDE